MLKINVFSYFVWCYRTHVSLSVLSSIVKVLCYSLQPVILLCWLHNLPQIIEPFHSWFHLNSPGSIQPGCLLVHRTDQLTMSSNHHYSIFLNFFGTMGQWKWICPRPPYDRFSQDSNPWSSDHWYCAWTNSVTIGLSLEWVGRGTVWFSSAVDTWRYRQSMLSCWKGRGCCSKREEYIQCRFLFGGKIRDI